MNVVLTKEFLYKEYIENEKALRQIAKETGFAYSTIITHLEKNNIKRRTISEGRKDKRLRKILTKEYLKSEYIDKNKSAPQIAKEIGCLNSLVWRYLVGFNIKRRSHSESYVKRTPPNYVGKYITKNDYVYITAYKHPNKTKNGYVFEHRLVMEGAIGRYLKSDEVVHHLNGIRNDNRIENLALTNRKEHEVKTLMKILQKRIKYLEKEINKEKI